MEVLLAITAGVLYAAGIYLMLRRRLAQLIIGLGLLNNGTTILIFTSGGLTRSNPPILPAAPDLAAQPFADPVPQSLILTAIVIGFGVLAFSLVLAHQVHRATGADDLGDSRK
jgi:multicomponent Na+:H+ antiporter subunit C